MHSALGVMIPVPVRGSKAPVQNSSKSPVQSSSKTKQERERLNETLPPAPTSPKTKLN